jgi:hypothetical protein
MPDRIGDRDCATLRDAEQREPFDAGGVDHRFEVVYELLERNFLNIAVRQPFPLAS